MATNVRDEIDWLKDQLTRAHARIGSLETIAAHAMTHYATSSHDGFQILGKTMVTAEDALKQLVDSLEQPGKEEELKAAQYAWSCFEDFSERVILGMPTKTTQN